MRPTPNGRNRPPARSAGMLESVRGCRDEPQSGADAGSAGTRSRLESDARRATLRASQAQSPSALLRTILQSVRSPFPVPRHLRARPRAALPLPGASHPSARAAPSSTRKRASPDPREMVSRSRLALRDFALIATLQLRVRYGCSAHAAGSSDHPVCIRGLSRATRRRCDPRHTVSCSRSAPRVLALISVLQRRGPSRRATRHDW
ncbi:hypothetical protein B0H15DRAFT_277615 [Mycena belliarum]|uniref:Uncharacterized protein n=1 Tax=Mycena belliarum TaxID=1033014 RepID=A0AAD6TQ74_9AGAR|nr:hypothetical protein B0H15DRAFT_277615 [Mycena belliae]